MLSSLMKLRPYDLQGVLLLINGVVTLCMISEFIRPVNPVTTKNRDEFGFGFPHV